jgi:hypothetical protein
MTFFGLCPFFPPTTGLLPNPVLYEKLKDREQKEKSLFERNENKKKIPSHTDTFPESREKSFTKKRLIRSM